MSQFTGKPVDRSAVKSIYILVAEDPTTKEKVQYYKTDSLSTIETAGFFEFRGFLLTKAQADNLVKQSAATSVGIEVNRKIPVHRIIRIENVTYTKVKTEAQGE
jgi:hypothetical protein